MRLCKLTAPSGPVWAVLREGRAFFLDGTPYDKIEETGESAPIEGAKLLPPCDPGKIVCVGKNYYDHATELGGAVPETPIIFIKPSTALLEPFGKIIYPESSGRVDYECELALVIKKEAKNVPAERAGEYILGYTCLNDVTARDIQSADGQWTRAKGFDSFCPIGPVVTDEVDPKSGLLIETRLNGEVKQKSTTDKMLWDVPFLLSFITACMTLLPGDVLTTGTPAGIGPMERGDRVCVSVEGIDELENYVV